MCLIAVAEAKEDWRAAEVESFAKATFEIALVAPMKKAEVTTVNDEPWRASICLDHIAELWMRVFKASRWMRVNRISKQFVEVGSLKLGMASGVNLGGKFEDLRNIFAGDGASHDDWCVWNEVEIVFEIVENFVATLALEVGFGDDENDAFAGVNDLAGESLIELGMRLGAIDKHAADVGFFDSGKAAECGEFFDADFALSWLAKTCGVEQFDCAALVADFGTVDVAGGAGKVCDDGLLFLRERVKEARFADVRTTDQSNLNAVIWLFFPGAHIETELFERAMNLAAEFIEAKTGRSGNANWIFGAEH